MLMHFLDISWYSGMAINLNERTISLSKQAVSWNMVNDALAVFASHHRRIHGEIVTFFGDLLQNFERSAVPVKYDGANVELAQ